MTPIRGTARSAKGLGRETDPNNHQGLNGPPKILHAAGARTLAAASRLGLRYEAVTEDLAKLTVFKKWKRISDTLRQDGAALLIHGNSRITVSERGLNNSNAFNTLRMWRAWTAPLDSESGRTTAPFTSGGGSTAFVVDTIGNGPSWIDVPGQQFPIETLAEQQPTRVILEFIVGVDGHTEAGGLHFMVGIDITSDRYRVRMYEAHKFTPESWVEVFPQGFPSGERVTVPVALIRWRPAANPDETRVALDYGWQNFPEAARE